MSDLQTAQYQRKPFFVDAIQVSTENMDEVSKWCQGDVRIADNGKNYIKVRVHRPINDRQTMAYPGDWVLYAGTGYKVYTDQAFKKTFDQKADEQPVELRSVSEEV